MQHHELASYSPESATISGGPESVDELPAEAHTKAIDDHHKKNVLGKVKERAKKLKSKIKKPKAENEEASEESGSDEEDESDHEVDQIQQLETQLTGETDKDATALGSSVLESSLVPDVNATIPGSGVGVHEEFGKIHASDEAPERLQEEMPSAPGQTSAGVAENLESHGFGKNPLNNEPSGTEALGSEAAQSELKSTTGSLLTAAKETVGAAAAAGGSALGLQSMLHPEGGDAQNRSEPKKSMLEQAKERIFGSSKSISENSKTKVDDDTTKASGARLSLTSRAAGSMMSFKDAFASKLGYSPKSPMTSTSDKSESLGTDKDQDESSKSVLQKVQDSALNMVETVTSKIGSTGDADKSYLERIEDSAANVRDTVVSKTGYGAEQDVGQSSGTDQRGYLEKIQDTAVGAKDAVMSKLSPRSNKPLSGVDEGSYTGEENVPLDTAERFHPGEGDRALSQLITEKLSIGASTLKDTLLKPFGATKPEPLTVPGSTSVDPASVASDPSVNVSGGNDENMTFTPNTDDAGNTGGIASTVNETVSAVTENVSSLLKGNDDEGLGDVNNGDEAGICTVEMKQS